MLVYPDLEDLSIEIIVHLPCFMSMVITNTDGSWAVFRALVDANLLPSTSFGRFIQLVNGV